MIIPNNFDVGCTCRPRLGENLIPIKLGGSSRNERSRSDEATSTSLAPREKSLGDYNPIKKRFKVVDDE